MSDPFKKIIPKDWKNIENIIEKTHKVFTLFGWTWYDMKTVPTKEMIREAILELYVSLNNPFDEENDWVSSGRLRLVRECVDRPDNQYEYVVDIEFGGVYKNYD